MQSVKTTQFGLKFRNEPNLFDWRQHAIINRLCNQYDIQLMAIKAETGQ